MAYDIAARERFGARADLLAFWASKLSMGVDEVDAFLGGEPFPHDAIRAKLMKRGGLGYAQPDAGTFPPLEAVNEAIVACGAIPTYAFLDGLSEGERHIDELLERLMDRGLAGITLIPERNWNVADPEERGRKMAEFGKLMELSRSLHLPVLAGTEMNKPGQRLIDDLDVEALCPYRPDFMRGADFASGHTLLLRALGQGYYSDWSRQNLPDGVEWVAFYTQVGRAVAPSPQTLARVAQMDPSLGPDELLARLEAL